MMNSKEVEAGFNPAFFVSKRNFFRQKVLTNLLYVI
nr:MAG TPA: hypothetical protein [Caudoviricetes sp.]